MYKLSENIVLYFSLAFYVGFCSMAIEILAGKSLAVFFGGAIYVWGGIIGIILLGITGGYFIGGRLADKNPQKTIIWTLLLATLSILLIPFLNINLVANLRNLLPDTIALLSALLIIYFIPALLLAIVPPCILKILTKDLKLLGKRSGDLYATSSLGSILGVLITSFILVYLVPSKILFLIFAVILLFFAIALTKQYSQKLIYGSLALLIIILITATIADMYVYKPEIKENIIQENSPFGLVSVKDNERYKTLYVNGGAMGRMDKSNIFNITSGSEFLECMAIEVKDKESILILGVGPATLPKYLHHYKDANVVAVDINPVIMKFAQEHFNLTADERMELVVEDARRYLEKNNQIYDHILMDISQVDIQHVLPQHLVTTEFFYEVAKDLDANGTFSLNTIVTEEKWRNSTFAQRTIATVNANFDKAYIREGCYFAIITATHQKELLCETDPLCIKATSNATPSTDQLIGYLPYVD